MRKFNTHDVSTLHQSTGRRLTASAKAINGSCCDHKVSRSKAPLEVQKKKQNTEKGVLGLTKSVHEE